jgi:imidazolonepropionase-like amidohydrolase
MTLMPGLVEGHCHLSFVGRGAIRIWARFRRRSTSCAPAVMRLHSRSRIHVLLLAAS